VFCVHPVRTLTEAVELAEDRPWQTITVVKGYGWMLCILVMI